MSFCPSASPRGEAPPQAVMRGYCAIPSPLPLPPRGGQEIKLLSLIKKATRQFSLGGFLYYLFLVLFVSSMQRISSAEQPIKLHRRDKFAKVGCVLPERYCEIVPGVTSRAFAISVFFFPQVSISYFKFCVIRSSKLFSITIFYLVSLKKCLTF